MQKLQEELRQSIFNQNTNEQPTVEPIVEEPKLEVKEVDITKYEFSSDGGTTWVDNGTNNTYTFKLKENDEIKIKSVTRYNVYKDSKILINGFKYTETYNKNEVIESKEIIHC